jgi:hypothetical protein
MFSRGTNSKKMQQTSSAVDAMGSLDQAESQIDRAQQGVAGSLEVSETLLFGILETLTYIFLSYQSHTISSVSRSWRTVTLVLKLAC